MIAAPQVDAARLQQGQMPGIDIGHRLRRFGPGKHHLDIGHVVACPAERREGSGEHQCQICPPDHRVARAQLETAVLTEHPGHKALRIVAVHEMAVIHQQLRDQAALFQLPDKAFRLAHRFPSRRQQQLCEADPIVQMSRPQRTFNRSCAF